MRRQFTTCCCWWYYRGGRERGRRRPPSIRRAPNWAARLASSEGRCRRPPTASPAMKVTSSDPAPASTAAPGRPWSLCCRCPSGRRPRKSPPTPCCSSAPPRGCIAASALRTRADTRTRPRLVTTLQPLGAARALKCRGCCMSHQRRWRGSRAGGGWARTRIELDGRVAYLVLRKESEGELHVCLAFLPQPTVRHEHRKLLPLDQPVLVEVDVVDDGRHLGAVTDAARGRRRSAWRLFHQDWRETRARCCACACSGSRVRSRRYPTHLLVRHRTAQLRHDVLELARVTVRARFHGAAAKAKGM